MLAIALGVMVGTNLYPARVPIQGHRLISTARLLQAAVLTLELSATAHRGYRQGRLPL